ncbi:MAG: 30S ribosomal protein S21 [Elusimicrobiota bacterium]
MPKGPKVEKKDNETIHSVLRRFRRACSKAGIKNELKKRRFYSSPSEIKNINKSKEKRRNLRNKIKRKQKRERIKTKMRRG